MHALVLSRAIAEAMRLAKALGGDPTTMTGLAGMGDLVAVQARPEHPSYQFGVSLAKGTRPDSGPVDIARALLTLARIHSVELPLTEALVRVNDGEDPIDAVGRLMSRKAMREHE